MGRVALSGLLSLAIVLGCSGTPGSPPPDPSATKRLPSPGSIEPSPAASSTSPTATAAPSTCSTPGPAAASGWRDTGSMLEPHAFHTATLLPSGRVLVTGGVINDRVDGFVLAEAELTATILADGSVLVAGDYNDLSPATTELFGSSAP